MTLKVKYSKTFWVANTVELFERAAFYAMFIAITLYLTNVVGFNDIWAAWITGVFAAGLYLLPLFVGAVADKIGFRKSIIFAFALQTIAYFNLGLLPYKFMVIPSLFLLMIGGAFIKTLITGTVAKTTTEANRAKGFSIFYAMVNVGSFSGKLIAYPIRINFGIEYINLFSALMTLIALITVMFLYHNIDTHNAQKTIKELFQGLKKVLTNTRLVTLMLIIAGFWIIQSQLYATLPKYVIRTVGVHATPEWIANVNPLVVVSCVYFITQLMKKFRPITSLMVGLLLMPISALAMSLSPVLENLLGPNINLFFGISAHPITIMLIIGIVFQGLAECFISPRYLEFFSLQAPKGEEGLYMGFGHLHSFVSYILGFGISGYLLTNYCPDPNTLKPDELKNAYDKAYYIWYYFAAIGLLSAIALYFYSKIIDHLDRGKAKTNE